MIVSLLLTMINNVADAMWVSGLGSDALAAIGIVTPIFIIIIGLGIGISAGVNSSVARFIGKGDLKQAGNSGVHGLIISIILNYINQYITIGSGFIIIICTMISAGIMAYLKPIKEENHE